MFEKMEIFYILIVYLSKLIVVYIVKEWILLEVSYMLMKLARNTDLFN